MKITIFNRVYMLPAGRATRILLGCVLVLGGIMGFLPVLGFWMIPLGFIVLSVDIPVIRRARRRVYVWFSRYWSGKTAPGANHRSSRGAKIGSHKK